MLRRSGRARPVGSEELTMYLKGSIVYVRKYKRIEVLRGKVTGHHISGVPDVEIVELDSGEVIPALAIQVANQERLEKLYERQNAKQNEEIAHPVEAFYLNYPLGG